MSNLQQLDKERSGMMNLPSDHELNGNGPMTYHFRFPVGHQYDSRQWEGDILHTAHSPWTDLAEQGVLPGGPWPLPGRHQLHEEESGGHPAVSVQHAERLYSRGMLCCSGTTLHFSGSKIIIFLKKKEPALIVQYSNYKCSLFWGQTALNEIIVFAVYVFFEQFKFIHD